MKLQIFASAVAIVLVAGTARADDVDTLNKRIDQLESQLQELRARLDHLGPVSAGREVKVVDPVFIGAGTKLPAPLSMDNATINCPAGSFVTAIQVLKTGNTVTQIRYACRGIQ